MAVWNGVVTTWGWLIEHLLYINLILSVVIVFFQRRDPKAVWTWLLVLYFIPIFGFVLYLILCQDFRKSRMFRVKEVEDRLRYSVESQEAAGSTCRTLSAGILRIWWCTIWRRRGPC